MSYFLDGKSPSKKTSHNSKGVFSILCLFVQVNLSLELFENRIFVRGPSDFHLKFSVRKPNCSNSETFENRGLTVVPSLYYRHTLHVIKKYNITKKELECGKIKTIYTRIINDLLPATRPVINNGKWKGVHNPILPNYLQTFNYNLVHNVLPFQTKLCDFSLDNPKSFCVFCSKGQNTAFHAFKSCEKLTLIWQFVDSLIEKTTAIAVPIVQDNYL